jgi:hypothetical protein
MKKLVVASAVSALFMAPVIAATSANLMLQGTVAQVQSVEITPVAGVHDNLDLSADAVDLKVAHVDEKSNSASGYKIMVESQNKGQLKNGNLGSVTYTMKYNNAEVELSNGQIEAKNVATGGVHSEQSDVQISYVGQPAAEMVEGSYSDVVTVSIQAN